MRFRQIAPDVYVASQRFINVYAIVKDRQTVMVDTGEPSFASPLIHALKALPPLGHVLLTHVHYDHVGGAARIVKETGARLHAHPLEAALLAQGTWRRPWTPSPTLPGRILTRLVADRYPDYVAPVDAEPICGESLDVAGGVRVVALPGHSAGQLGFGVPTGDGRNAWIIGDALMNVFGLREPILYEDRAEGLSSIARLMSVMTDGDLLCPGHGAPSEVRSPVRDRLADLVATT